MPRFKSITFYQNSRKIKLFLKKMQNFLALGAPHPDTQNSPPIASFWLRVWQLCTVHNHRRFCSFCFEQFFLDRSDANPVVLTADVCRMLNCFLFEKFFVWKVLLHTLKSFICIIYMGDFDSILCHCTKLFIRQGIHREQIFDITFSFKSCVRHWAEL